MLEAFNKIKPFIQNETTILKYFGSIVFAIVSFPAKVFRNVGTGKRRISHERSFGNGHMNAIGDETVARFERCDVVLIDERVVNS